MSEPSPKECAGEACAAFVKGDGEFNIQNNKINVNATTQNYYNYVATEAASKEFQDKTKPSHQGEAKSPQQESPQTSQGFDSIPRVNFITRPWRVRKFKNVVNESSLSKSDGGVADEYAERGLSEPNFEVYSRMQKLDHFFQGELATSKSFVQDYQRERICCPSSSGLNESQMISLEELKSLITGSDKKSRVIAILGMAGSGKSTLIKRLVRDITKIPRFELVCFLEIKDMAQISCTVSAKDLLFSGGWFAKLKPKDIYSGYKWAIKNEKKILFVLDGLDQAPWNFQENFRKVGYKEKASVEVVMANILSGILFKDAKIVIASREHSVSQLPRDLRPKTIISMMGLKLEDIEKLFDTLTSSPGAFQTLSPGIIPLCSIPLFVVFCAIVYKVYPGFQPKTMSAVVNKILEMFLHSTNNAISLDKEEGKHIVAVLKSLSLEAILEMRVTFDPKEFIARKVNPQMISAISAFTIKVPGHTVMSQKLFEKDYKLFFSHQTLQEQFASLEIYEMKLEKFGSFLRDQLHKPHLSVVKRFVCGLLSYLGDRNVENREEKWNIFKEHLRHQAGAATSSDEQLELLALLYESQDQDLIQSLVTKIDFADVVFTPATAHSLATILTSCRQLTLFRLRNCSFNEECIDILDRVTKDLQLQTNVAVVEGYFTEAWKLENFMKCLRPKAIILLLTNLSGMRETTSKWSLEETTVMTFDIRSSEYCEVIYPSPFCHRTVIQDDFQEKINSMMKKFITKIKRLDVSCNPELRRNNGFEDVGSIVAQCFAEQVSMRWCSIEGSDMTDFADGAGNAKISLLDVSYNKELCRNNGFKDVGSTVAQGSVEQVVMQSCGMEGSDMKDFANGAGKTKIKRLDVSWNDELRRNNGFKFVGSTVAQCSVEEVEMQWCKMEGSDMKDFANGAGKTKIKRLDVSDNDELRRNNGFKFVGSTVAQGSVEQVEMQSCGMEGSDMKDFANGAGKTKIKVLDISGNNVNPSDNFWRSREGLGERGLNEITRIVQRNEVEVLIMRECGFKSEQLEKFRKTIPDIEFRY